MEKYICIDIGGTSIKYGLAQETGNFLEKGQLPTEALTQGGAGILQKAKGIVAQYAANEVKGICISTAGMVDPLTGTIIHAAEHLIPGYTGISLKAEIEQSCRIRCEVENDVNCAGLGEMWLGAGKNAQSIFCMTIGTGIGGCIILNGKLIPGFSNSAGEIGYMHITGGILQDLASTSSLVKRAAALNHIDEEKSDGKIIFTAAKNGDAKMLRIIDETLQHLAEGIANVCYVINPEVIILGGGIMAQSDFLRPRLEKAMQNKLIPSVRRNTRLAFAELQNDAGMLGALYHFLQRNKER